MLYDISFRKGKTLIDLSRLVKGDAAIEWLKKDIREVAKEEVS